MLYMISVSVFSAGKNLAALSFKYWFMYILLMWGLLIIYLMFFVLKVIDVLLFYNSLFQIYTFSH